MTHLETWTAELSNIDGQFGGPFDKETGAFDLEADIYVDSAGERSAPGTQYACATDDTDALVSTCPHAEIVSEQTATVSGIIQPTGINEGEIDWYTAYCARITPEANTWGREGCPTAGAWEAEVTEVVWGENTAPEVGGLGASPAEPNSEDTVVFSVTATDPDGDDLTYTWYFDGVIDPASGPQASWAKPPPGDHEIGVDVSDGLETIERYLDIRVSEQVGAGDRDDDGVPDDEDLCPTEWGARDDGCPEFAATLGCSPARPMPEDSVTCTVTVAGIHQGETMVYDWYLDGDSVQSGSGTSWNWAASTRGEHDVLVDAGGEGRTATARLGLEVAGGVVDKDTAGFHITSLACNSGISSDEILGCTVNFERDREEIGPLGAIWRIDGQVAAQETTPGTSSHWSLDRPAPGDHAVQAMIVDPATNFAQIASAPAVVRRGRNDVIPPLVQAAAAGATLLTLGGWLWLEALRNSRLAAEAAGSPDRLGTLQLGGDGPLLDENGQMIWPNEDGLYQQFDDGQWRWVNRDQAAELIRDAQHWKGVHALERRRASIEHQQWSDEQWNNLIDRNQQWAEQERRGAFDRQRRLELLEVADRLQTVAIRHGYWDMVKHLDEKYENGQVAGMEELRQMRRYLGRRLSDDAAMRSYYQESDLDYFARGVQDDVAWCARQLGRTTPMGETGGTIAEWMVRNPEVPLRIALAVKTGGVSEAGFIYLDIRRGLDAAAAAKAKEQNAELSTGEVAWEVVKVGLWEIGGRIGGEYIAKALTPAGGAIDEVAEAATRRGAGASDEIAEQASRRGLDESSQRFVNRVRHRIARKEMGFPMEDLTEKPLKLPPGTRLEPDDMVRNVLREGDEISPQYWNETGIPARQLDDAGKFSQRNGVYVEGRTTNMTSMPGIRDGRFTPKWADIKGKTVNSLDLRLNPELDDTCRGAASYFEPKMPSLDDVPANLHDDLVKRFNQRMDQWTDPKLQKDIKSLLDGDLAVKKPNGMLVERATGKYFGGDWDAVRFIDAKTGQVVKGQRYVQLKNDWMANVAGQHGAEANIIEDLTRGYRPGTPEYKKALEGAEALMAQRQQVLREGKEVVIRMGPDGILRKGPPGPDIDLYADAAGIWRPSSPPPVVIPPSTPTRGVWPLVREFPPAGAEFASAGQELLGSPGAPTEMPVGFVQPASSPEVPSAVPPHPVGDLQATDPDSTAESVDPGVAEPVESVLGTDDTDKPIRNGTRPRRRDQGG
ncbi:MAG: hypothetical protein OEM81_10385 [Acidimicrobiia bacterium]|nr:hypothetical protein [Acidimicrobiia bacterium]